MGMFWLAIEGYAALSFDRVMAWGTDGVDAVGKKRLMDEVYIFFLLGI